MNLNVLYVKYNVHNMYIGVQYSCVQCTKP